MWPEAGRTAHLKIRRGFIRKDHPLNGYTVIGGPATIEGMTEFEPAALDEPSLLRDRILKQPRALQELLGEHARHTAAALLASSLRERSLAQLRAREVDEHMKIVRAGLIADIARLRRVTR